VKQIVDLSGGRIDIRSELGVGTEVKLSIPLEDRLGIIDRVSADSIALEDSPEDPIQAIRRRAKGRSVSIRGFDASVDHVDDLLSQAQASLKESIEKYVTKWFNLSIAQKENEESALADIVISDESVFLDAASSPDQSLTNPGRLLLILCSGGSKREIYSSRLHTNNVVEFISKPCGPHRLARALLNCLDKEDVISKAEFSQVSLSLFGVVSSTALDAVPPNNEQIDSSSKIQQRTTVSPVVVNKAKPGRRDRLINDLQTSIEYSPNILNHNSTSLSRSGSSVSGSVRSLSIISSSGTAPAGLQISMESMNEEVITPIKRSNSIDKEMGVSISTAPDSLVEMEEAGSRRPKMLLVDVCPVEHYHTLFRMLIKPG